MGRGEAVEGSAGAPSRAGADGDRRQRALAAAAADRVDEAVAICREALADGGPRWALEMLGYLLQRRGETRDALAALEQAAQQQHEPAKAELLYALARLYYRTGAFAKSIRTFERAQALDPGNGDACYLRGLAEFHAGQTRAAIASLGRASELDPANTIARYYLAVAHSRAGNLRSAIACLEQVVAAGGEDAAAHYHLGLAHYALGRMSEAARHFARSIEIDPYDERSRRMFVMLGERARRGSPRRGGARRAWRSSLVWKLTALAVAIFVIAGGGLALWLLRSAEADDLALNRARAEAISETVRGALRVPAGEERAALLGGMVDALGENRGLLFLRVTSKGGRVLASTRRQEVGSTLTTTEPPCTSCHSGRGSPRHADWAGLWREVEVDGKPGLELLSPLAERRADRGWLAKPLGMLQATVSLEEHRARLAARRTRALAVGAATSIVVLLAVAAIGWWLVRRPLATLEAAAGRVAAGELDVELGGERQDEVGRLVAAFNRMTRELRRDRHELDEVQHEMEAKIATAVEQHRAASEELRAANAKLVEFDRLKSAYVQKAIHDLRAPLSTILMTLENVSAGLVGPLGERQREALLAAQRRAEAMAQLVHDLLDLEYLRAGEARPRREPIAPSALLGKAIDAARARAQQKGVTLEAAELGALPAIVGDPAALGSVAENLLDNAVKYTRPGGLVRVEGRLEAGLLAIAVSDSGIGIPTTEIPLVFGEFFRASNARALERDGTGLGLAIVKRIAEAHGGSVAVESVEGTGTTVTLKLPLPGEGERQPR
jgi:signal transduction histidine kinase/tetratricopeptide (TPR) repeat protein